MTSWQKPYPIQEWCIHGIPAFQDNMIWAVVHTPSQQCVLIDPGCAPSVQNFLTAYSLQPCAVLITHHHADHVGGIAALQVQYPQLVLYGPPPLPWMQQHHTVGGQNLLQLLGLPWQVLAVPGHTLNHLAYVLRWPKAEATALFCGDTLFAAGCGRLFEGSAQQLWASLQQFKTLPANTLVFCAHEYTLSNLRFAHHVQPHNPAIAKRLALVENLRAQQQSTLPSTLGLELETNMFLQCTNAAEFAQLRQAKDQF